MRGGVLSAMETGYQGGKIQEESMPDEQREHDGSLPVIGVGTFLNPAAESTMPPYIELACSSEEEKPRQFKLKRLQGFHARHEAEALTMLQRLQHAVIDHQNVCGTDGRGACLLARAKHACAVRGGRVVPSQYVSVLFVRFLAV